MDTPKIPFGDAKRALKKLLKKSGAKIDRKWDGMGMYVPKTSDKGALKMMKKVGLKQNHIHISRGKDWMEDITGGRVATAIHEAGHSVDPTIGRKSHDILAAQQGKSHLSPRETEALQVHAEHVANKNSLNALKDTGSGEPTQKSWKKIANKQMKEGYRKPLIANKILGPHYEKGDYDFKPKLSDAKNALYANPHLRAKNVNLEAQIHEFIIGDIAGAIAGTNIPIEVRGPIYRKIRKALKNSKMSDKWKNRIARGATSVPGVVTGAGVSIGVGAGIDKLHQEKKKIMLSVPDNVKREYEVEQERKRKKLRRTAAGKLKNALVNGAAGAYLGSQIIHATEKDALRGSRVGAAIGAGVGLIQSHKKRSETAGAISSGGDWTFEANHDDDWRKHAYTSQLTGGSVLDTLEQRRKYKKAGKEHHVGHTLKYGLPATAGTVAGVVAGNKLAKPFRKKMIQAMMNGDVKAMRSNGWKSRAIQVTLPAAGALIGGSIGNKMADKDLNKKEFSKKDEEDLYKQDVVKSNIGGHLNSAITGLLPGAIIGGFLHGRKGVVKGALAGSASGIAARALLQKHINNVEDRHIQDIRKGKNTVKDGVKRTAHHTGLNAAVPLGLIGVGVAGVKSGKLLKKAANSKTARNIKAAIIKRERVKNPLRSTKRIPPGKIIDAHTNHPILDLPENAVKREFSALDKIKAGLKHIHGSGIMHASDAVAKRVAPEVVRAGIEKAAPAGAMGYLKGAAKGLVGKGQDYSEEELQKAWSNHLADAAKNYPKDLGKRLREKLNPSKSITKAKTKKVAKIAGVTAGVAGAGYIAGKTSQKKEFSRSEWDDYEDHPKPKRVLTPQEHDEVKRDRRKLLKGALLTAAAAPLAAYAVSGNPAVREIRSKIGSALKHHAPGVADHPWAEKMFPRHYGSFTDPVMKEARRSSQSRASVAKRKSTNIDKDVNDFKPHHLKAKIRAFFFGDNQIVEGDNRYANPIYVATGKTKGYLRDYDKKTGVATGGKTEISARDAVGHHQVVRGTYNKAKQVHKHGGRALKLAKDAVDVIKGEPRVKDPWGRRRKREWEKSWFKNAAGAAALTVGGLAAIKRFPKQASSALTKAEKLKNAITGHIPKELQAAIDETKEFDYTAPHWDVKNQHRNSVRVYAQGAQPRERREKKWHEKVGVQRKLAGAALLATGIGAFSGGHKIGLKKGIRKGASDLLKNMEESSTQQAAYNADRAAIMAAEKVRDDTIRAARKAQRKGASSLGQDMMDKEQLAKHKADLKAKIGRSPKEHN